MGTCCTRKPWYEREQKAVEIFVKEVNSLFAISLIIQPLCQITQSRFELFFILISYSFLYFFYFFLWCPKDWKLNIETMEKKENGEATWESRCWILKKSNDRDIKKTYSKNTYSKNTSMLAKAKIETNFELECFLYTITYTQDVRTYSRM